MLTDGCQGNLELAAWSQVGLRKEEMLNLGI